MEPNYEIAIRTDILKASLVFAGKSDIRDYINSVCIDLGREGARLVSTDEYRLSVCVLDREEYKESRVIIPRAAVENAIKGMAKNSSVLFSFEQGVLRAKQAGVATHDMPRRVRVLAGDEVTISELDGTFPDWRRVVPKESTGEQAFYAPAYVMDMQKAAEILGASKHRRFLIRPNGPVSCGYCLLKADFHAFVGPLGNTSVDSLPEWTGYF